MVAKIANLRICPHSVCVLTYLMFGLLTIPIGEPVAAQQTSGQLGQPTNYFDAADTSSPRATLMSFIDAGNEIHSLIESETYLNRTNAGVVPAVRRMLDCVNSTDLPAFAREERAAEVAVCLKEILDRCELPPWPEIPGTEEIEALGGQEQLPRWRIPGTRITIAQVESGPQRLEYLFSAGTVDRAVEYYHDLEPKAYRESGPETSPGFYRWFISSPGHPWMHAVVKHLPEWLRYNRTLGMTNWKWPGVLLNIVLGLVVMVILYRLQFRYGNRFRKSNIILYSLTIVFPLLALFVPLVVLNISSDLISVRGDPLYIISFVCNALSTFAGIICVFALCNRAAEAIISSPSINPRGLNAQLVRIATRLVSVGLAVAVVLFGGQYLGIPLATLLASAGIGGVALALGAQDTLKTLFGTVMLMADKPFRVGDRIVFRGYDGIVEDIGLRSTRLRLLSSHQVTIPNDELARSDIENIARRECIRRMSDIHIPLDTPSDKTRAAVEFVRKQLENHEGMHEERPPRVYFLDFMKNAFVIRMIYWYHPPEYWDYLAYGEKLNFKIQEEFDRLGIQFALTHRVSQSIGPDGTARELSESELAGGGMDDDEGSDDPDVMQPKS